MSYAMNPNQPKKAEPIYPDTDAGRLAVAPVLLPYTVAGVVERFNPGRADRLKKPAAFALLLETASNGLLNPNSLYRNFRLDHADRRKMNLVFADAHAEPRPIIAIYPSAFDTSPPRPMSDRKNWPPEKRALWFGNEGAIGPTYS
jgi:hypothetical protein